MEKSYELQKFLEDHKEELKGVYVDEIIQDKIRQLEKVKTDKLIDEIEKIVEEDWKKENEERKKEEAKRKAKLESERLENSQKNGHYTEVILIKGSEAP